MSFREMFNVSIHNLTSPFQFLILQDKLTPFLSLDLYQFGIGQFSFLTFLSIHKTETFLYPWVFTKAKNIE